MVAVELDFTVERMAKIPADYAKYQKAAWMSLNERMLASGAQLVLAFHPNIDTSRGSKHLVELARGIGVEVQTFAE